MEEQETCSPALHLKELPLLPVGRIHFMKDDQHGVDYIKPE